MEQPFPQRKRTRAQGFDYREPGPYFVTVCELHRKNRFGRVVNQQMEMYDAGEMVLSAWETLPDKFPGIILDAFILMPNHLHGLLTFDSVAMESNASLSAIMQWFKTMTTNWYMRGVKDHGWPRFDGHLWQRSFHDRIVRTDAEMDRFRTYIASNPALWTQDTFHEP